MCSLHENPHGVRANAAARARYVLFDQSVDVVFDSTRGLSQRRGRRARVAGETRQLGVPLVLEDVVLHRVVGPR